MYFESSKPVTGLNFFNRQKELAEMVNTIKLLKKGSSKYLALIGHRKTGKTSLLRKFMEVVNEPDVVFYELDCWEKKPSPKIFFQDYLLQVMDQYLNKFHSKLFEKSLRRNLTHESNLLTMLSDIKSLNNDSLDEAVDCLLQLRGNNISDTLFSSIINFPEKLAHKAGIYFVSIIDEFQELIDLNRFKNIKENIGDIYAFFRACWQKHEKVNYIIAGSKISMMKELVTSERSPFFQHFKILEIKDFNAEDAEKMLLSLSEHADYKIPQKYTDKMIELIGTNPFYLQIVGGELCEKEINEDTFKIVMQENLFTSTGRLYLYFQDLIGRVVGRSSSLEQTLVTIARHPSTLSKLASQMNVGTGTLKSWINRISDFIIKDKEIYKIQDKCLRLWIENKSDLKPFLPPLVLGTEAEKFVAQKMAQAGFELIYQSRASRGSFDLLAILNNIEVGVQVKMGSFPFYLKKNDHQLMMHWAKQLNWKPLFTLVCEKEIYFYDVSKWQIKGQSYRIDQKTEKIDNLLYLYSSAK